MGFISVEKEYEKNKELKKDDIKLLQEWLSKQPHLPSITELQLIQFLHSCYYRVEPTKTCIEVFYTARLHCPEFFKKRDPTGNCAEILDMGLYVPLPQKTPLGHQVLYTRMLDPSVERYSLPAQIKCFDMSIVLMLNQLGIAPGHVILIDMKGFTFAHFTKVNPVQLKKFFVYLQEGLPIRLLGMYYINIPSFMDKVMTLIKPMMKKELLETLHMFTDKFDELYKFIPQECLPHDYGGKAPSINELINRRNANFRANAKYFVDAEKDVSDESKRIGKPKNASDVFGVEGTFKKLDID